MGWTLVMALRASARFVGACHDADDVWTLVGEGQRTGQWAAIRRGATGGRLGLRMTPASTTSTFAAG